MSFVVSSSTIDIEECFRIVLSVEVYVVLDINDRSL